MVEMTTQLKEQILKTYPSGYFCTKCEKLHKKASAIYFNHWEYASISLMVRSVYHCTKCNRSHRAGSKIFDAHFAFMGEHL